METKKTFGQWLLEKRNERGMGLRSLAFSANLNASTISRIERAQIDPAMSTVARITHSLGVTAEEYHEFLTGKSIHAPMDDRPIDPSVITLEDVIGFEQLARVRPDTVEGIVAEVLNDIQRSIPKGSHSSHVPPYSFRADGIIRLINGSSLYSLQLHYPYSLEFSIDADSIMDIYIKGGLIIRNDVAAYISVRSRDVGLRPIQGSEEAKIPTILKTRIFDRSEREIRLSELERADHFLSKDHEILVMGWIALRYERMAMLQLSIEEIPRWAPADWWNLQNLKFGYTLIIMDRWMKALGNSDTHWLSKIREEME